MPPVLPGTPDRLGAPDAPLSIVTPHLHTEILGAELSFYTRAQGGRSGPTPGRTFRLKSNGKCGRDAGLGASFAAFQ